MMEFHEFMKALDKIRNTDWNEAEKIFFENWTKLQEYIFTKKPIVLMSSRVKDRIQYYVIENGKPKILQTDLKVDDFYYPSDLIKEKMNIDYLSEKAENYDYADPVDVAIDLHSILESLEVVAIKSLDFMRLSEDEADKLLDMVNAIEHSVKVVKKCLEEGIKSYFIMKGIAMGLTKRLRNGDDNRT